MNFLVVITHAEGSNMYQWLQYGMAGSIQLMFRDVFLLENQIPRIGLEVLHPGSLVLLRRFVLRTLNQEITTDTTILNKTRRSGRTRTRSNLSHSLSIFFL